MFVSKIHYDTTPVKVPPEDHLKEVRLKIINISSSSSGFMSMKLRRLVGITSIYIFIKKNTFLCVSLCVLNTSATTLDPDWPVQFLWRSIILGTLPQYLTPTTTTTTTTIVLFYADCLNCFPSMCCVGGTAQYVGNIQPDNTAGSTLTDTALH